jgi:hypothetical protein
MLAFRGLVALAIIAGDEDEERLVTRESGGVRDYGVAEREGERRVVPEVAHGVQVDPAQIACINALVVVDAHTPWRQSPRSGSSVPPVERRSSPPLGSGGQRSKLRSGQRRQPPLRKPSGRFQEGGVSEQAEQRREESHRCKAEDGGQSS